MTRNVTSLLLALLVLASPLAAGWETPRNRGYVTDLTGAMRPDTQRWLAANLGMFDRRAGVQMAVLLVPDLQGTTPADYAQRTFDDWKIGSRTTRKGLLLLVATADRKVRLHVGYGLEGDLPDGKVGALLDQHLLPLLKAGDIDGAVKSGVAAVMQALGTAAQDSPGLGAFTGRHRRPPSSGPTTGALIVILVLGVLCIVSPFWRDVILNMLIWSAISGRHSGGSFSGGSGFGGFGGGSSGGGGADRGW
ncbi:MAG: TPM domain-containing protein [Candidatus Wallbacteria bacterium]|nr:TPM domain-containing protein [Candidatus Wallbacteria bacterium]